jgi:hypothetical protein
MNELSGRRPQMNELSELLLAAQAQPIGILVQTSNPERLRQRLYVLRANGGDQFENLQFRLSSLPDGNLVIFKKAAPAQPAEQTLDLSDFVL